MQNMGLEPKGDDRTCLNIVASGRSSPAASDISAPSDSAFSDWDRRQSSDSTPASSPGLSYLDYYESDFVSRPTSTVQQPVRPDVTQRKIRKVASAAVPSMSVLFDDGPYLSAPIFSPEKNEYEYRRTVAPAKCGPFQTHSYASNDRTEAAPLGPDLASMTTQIYDHLRYNLHSFSDAIYPRTQNHRAAKQESGFQNVALNSNASRRALDLHPDTLHEPSGPSAYVLGTELKRAESIPSRISNDDNGRATAMYYKATTDRASHERRWQSAVENLDERSMSTTGRANRQTGLDAIFGQTRGIRKSKTTGALRLFTEDCCRTCLVGYSSKRDRKLRSPTVPKLPRNLRTSSPRPNQDVSS